MTDISQVINYILPRDKQVEVIVSELRPASKLFPSGKSKNPDGNIRCHSFMAQYSEFPNPVPVQWCNSNVGVSEFKNGDRILISGGVYNNDFLIQSVTWVKTFPKENQRQIMQAIADTAPTTSPKGERRVSDNSNPSVMGTLWSICIGHAVTLNKDRQDKKGNHPSMKDVMMDAELLMQDFKNKYNND